MEYLLGWSLLLGIIGIIAVVIRFAGTPGKPQATCGTGACGMKSAVPADGAGKKSGN